MWNLIVDVLISDMCERRDALSGPLISYDLHCSTFRSFFFFFFNLLTFHTYLTRTPPLHTRSPLKSCSRCSAFFWGFAACIICVKDKALGGILLRSSIFSPFFPSVWSLHPPRERAVAKTVFWKDDVAENVQQQFITSHKAPAWKQKRLLLCLIKRRCCTELFIFRYLLEQLPPYRVVCSGSRTQCYWCAQDTISWSVGKGVACVQAGTQAGASPQVWLSRCGLMSGKQRGLRCTFITHQLDTNLIW